MHAECLRSVERGEVDDSFRLSRRHRWKPLAIDVHGDEAVVVVATRGKRIGGAVTTQKFRRREGQWSPVGWSGGGGDERTLPMRPPPGERWFRLDSSGMSVDSQATGIGRRSQVHHLVVQVAEGVSHVGCRGRRRLVADHGFVCAVWRGRSMPSLEMFDGAGRSLDTVGRADLRSPMRQMPWRARVRYAIFQRRRPGEWFNYAPRR